MIAAKKPLSVLFTCAIVASATATCYCVATTGVSRDDVVIKSDGAYRTIRMLMAGKSINTASARMQGKTIGA